MSRSAANGSTKSDSFSFSSFGADDSVRLANSTDSRGFGERASSSSASRPSRDGLRNAKNDDSARGDSALESATRSARSATPSRVLARPLESGSRRRGAANQETRPRSVAAALGDERRGVPPPRASARRRHRVRKRLRDQRRAQAGFDRRHAERAAHGLEPPTRARGSTRSARQRVEREPGRQPVGVAGGGVAGGGVAQLAEHVERDASFGRDERLTTVFGGLNGTRVAPKRRRPVVASVVAPNDAAANARSHARNAAASAATTRLLALSCVSRSARAFAAARTRKHAAKTRRATRSSRKHASSSSTCSRVCALRVAMASKRSSSSFVSSASSAPSASANAHKSSLARTAPIATSLCAHRKPASATSGRGDAHAESAARSAGASPSSTPSPRTVQTRRRLPREASRARVPRHRARPGPEARTRSRRARRTPRLDARSLQGKRPQVRLEETQRVVRLSHRARRARHAVRGEA